MTSDLKHGYSPNTSFASLFIFCVIKIIPLPFLQSRKLHLFLKKKKKNQEGQISHSTPKFLRHASLDWLKALEVPLSPWLQIVSSLLPLSYWCDRTCHGQGTILTFESLSACPLLNGSMHFLNVLLKTSHIPPSTVSRLLYIKNKQVVQAYFHFKV